MLRKAKLENRLKYNLFKDNASYKGIKLNGSYYHKFNYLRTCNGQQ